MGVFCGLIIVHFLDNLITYSGAFMYATSSLSGIELAMLLALISSFITHSSPPTFLRLLMA